MKLWNSTESREQGVPEPVVDEIPAAVHESLESALRYAALCHQTRFDDLDESANKAA